MLTKVVFTVFNANSELMNFIPYCNKSHCLQFPGPFCKRWSLISIFMFHSSSYQISVFSFIKIWGCPLNQGKRSDTTVEKTNILLYKNFEWSFLSRPEHKKNIRFPYIVSFLIPVIFIPFIFAFIVTLNNGSFVDYPCHLLLRSIMCKSLRL